MIPRLPQAFQKGLRLFNSGRFFEAHEAFEELLDDVETDERWDLLLALIQIAVGYHKCTAGHPGAAGMLTKGLAGLSAFADDAGGVAVGGLRVRVLADRDVLVAGGPLPLVPPPRIRLVR